MLLKSNLAKKNNRQMHYTVNNTMQATQHDYCSSEMKESRYCCGSRSGISSSSLSSDISCSSSNRQVLTKKSRICTRIDLIYITYNLQSSRDGVKYFLLCLVKFKLSM